MRRINKKKPEKRKKEKDGGDEGKEVIKSPIPKNLGELFDLAKQIVPGTEDLQTRNEKSWKLLHSVLTTGKLDIWYHHLTPPEKPIFQDLPDVAKTLTPTLIEMKKVLQGESDIPDGQLANWGKALVKDKLQRNLFASDDSGSVCYGFQFRFSPAKCWAK